MISEERTEVVVIGGGISGLSAAAVLQVKSCTFELHCLRKKYVFEGGRYPSCPTGGTSKAWGSNLYCRGRTMKIKFDQYDQLEGQTRGSIRTGSTMDPRWQRGELGVEGSQESRTAWGGG